MQRNLRAEPKALSSAPCSPERRIEAYAYQATIEQGSYLLVCMNRGFVRQAGCMSDLRILCFAVCVSGLTLPAFVFLDFY
jgi:hypothetical protein